MKIAQICNLPQHCGSCPSESRHRTGPLQILDIQVVMERGGGELQDAMQLSQTVLDEVISNRKAMGARSSTCWTTFSE